MKKIKENKVVNLDNENPEYTVNGTKFIVSPLFESEKESEDTLITLLLQLLTS